MRDLTRVKHTAAREMSAIEWGYAAGLGYFVVVEILSQQRRDVPPIIVNLFSGAEVTRQFD